MLLIESASNVFLSLDVQGKNWRESWFPVHPPIRSRVSFRRQQKNIRKMAANAKTTQEDLFLLITTPLDNVFD